MTAYDPNFLGAAHTIPLPTFAHSVNADDVLHDNPLLRDGSIADYINYSLVMSADPERRSPMFVALNIDQHQLRDTDRDDNWKIDERVGFAHQLDNDYYRDNPWDRGHMARRVSAAHGPTKRAAQRADEETFYYTNSTLQHANLNRDEWLALEDWVLNLELAANGKITSFSGPIYGDFDRSVTPTGRDLARVPAGFFKIVCFEGVDTGNLDVRAFIIYQDEDAVRDRRGRRRFNNQNYQVTVSEIEDLTGLLFDDAIYNANPLIYTLPEGDARRDTLVTPERYEVGSPFEIINEADKRQTIKDDIVDVFIAAAMVDASGNDAAGEWISIINLDTRDVDLSNWLLADNSLLSLKIGNAVGGGSAVLRPGQSLVVSPVDPLKLGNKGDVIRLFDDTGARIDWVSYNERMVSEGVPVLFLSPRDTLDLDVQGANRR